MSLEFELAGTQIDGARDYQEDAFLITHLTDNKGDPSALVVIADGMGGHAAGNVASNMAVQAFNKHISSNYPAENIADILEQATVKANNSIKETVAETPALSGMGCTMVVALLEKGKMWWVSVGDSHCYLVRNRELVKKNADHSYGGFLDRMEAEGTPVEAEPGLSRNMLMSAVTGEDINEIDVSRTPFELEAGDKVVLCSDGLDTLSAGKIIQYSDWSESPKECADALMQAVEDANMPRQDNTTAVVVTVKDPAAAAIEEEPITEDVLEATSEMSLDEIEAENAAAEAEVATVEEPEVKEEIETPIQQELDTFEQSKSKTGLFIGIAAAIVLIVGAGAFFTMGGDQPAQQAEPILAEEVKIEEMEVVEEDVSMEEEQESEVAAEEEQPAVAEAKPEPEVKAATGKTIQDNLKSGGKAPVMVVIPAGKFKMGSTSSKNSDERPRHDVSVALFAVSQHEVTFAEYDIFAKATGRKVPDSLYMDRAITPVIFVSWDDAYYYTKWLSEQTGEKYRLLSEAEWEYMASTGKKSTFWWGYDDEPNRAHCFGCGTGLDPRKPTRVGSFEANAFGVFDTAGNVSEWIHDCWHKNYNGAPKQAETWEGGDCTFRAVRGGAYSSPTQSIRSVKRDKFKSDKTYDQIGIRLARDVH